MTEALLGFGAVFLLALLRVPLAFATDWSRAIPRRCFCA